MSLDALYTGPRKRPRVSVGGFFAQGVQGLGLQVLRVSVCKCQRTLQT